MLRAISRESGNAGSALDGEKRQVAPAPPALPRKIRATYLIRPRQAHPLPEPEPEPVPPQSRMKRWRTLARDYLPRREGQVRSLFRPQTYQESRLFREFAPGPIVPNDMIGSLNFFRQRRLRADNGLRFLTGHSRSLHQSFFLDLFRAGHHRHAIAKHITARFIKKWYIGKK